MIENIECGTKEDLLKRERHYIESIECVNKNRPIISVEEKKEYYNNNKEAIVEKKKEHYNNNKEQIAQYKK